ncbi:MAG: nucleotide sugar dehydrogenase [Chlamydiae bacterium]|nr:nucleotide sugar dehydrogenase [Chlamydiota bacterium]MBI3265503.1 nucleotide sugar dehydrogenase [Chlamydiota bacterium]
MTHLSSIFPFRGVGVNFKDRVKERDICVGVIGLGYVGLPLAVAFAEAGFHTLGFDLLKEKVAKINQGLSYIPDVAKNRLRPLVKKGLLEATSDFSRLREVDAISICVPTPLRKTKDPDISHIIQSVEAVAQYLRKGQLVVLESTTYPGTTEEVVLPILEGKGKKVGKDFFLAFSPERIDPGNAHYETRNIPKIIGGMTPLCTERAKTLYESIVVQVVSVSSTQVAEMVKLLENTFRAVNIGLVNEMAILCHKMRIDMWEVIEGARTKPFGFMAFYPGPGLGGHCIPVDPIYLSWKAKLINSEARFIDLAAQVNGQMPHHVRDLVVEGLNREKKALNGAKILILGVTYKKDVDDVRESPALDIWKLLSEGGGDVSYHDPYVPQLRIELKTFKCQPLTSKVLKQADAVVIISDHSVFNYAKIVKEARLVVDTRHATRNVKSGRDKIVKI